jgi:ribosomal-protein-alanine N-acetyltransferase
MMDVHLDAGVCKLRRWQTDDLEALVRHADNRNVWLTLRDRFPHPYTQEAGQAWLGAVVPEDPPGTLAIAVHGEAIGGIGVIPGVDVNRHAAELGYWIGEAYWGRGIMTSAIRRFQPWAGDALGVTRLYSHVFASNPGSARVLEKCGFVREGVLRRHARKDGVLLDEYVYGWLAEDGR